ncbi:hypothetical protein [Bradyrhizobium sp. USDA 4452]
MATKYFCDVCDREMTWADLGRIKRTVGKVSIEIETAFDGVWNAGHICHSCIVGVVTAPAEPANPSNPEIP